MLFEVAEDVIFRLRPLDGSLFYKEDEDKVELWLVLNNVTLTATHYRNVGPEMLEDGSSGPDPYLLWKQQHLENALPVRSARTGSLELRVL